jgi:hypothetical protein
MYNYLQGLYLVSNGTEVISNDYKECFCGGKGANVLNK